MDRAEKAQTVGALKADFLANTLVVVAHYSGLTVAELTNLRRAMRAADASVQVTKNRLARIAIRDTDHASLDDLFRGPTAIALSKDPVAAAKVATAFAKDNEKFVVLGGSLGGQLLNVDGVKALATLPSIDALRGKLLGLIVAPATRIAGILQAPGGQLARVISAHANKDQEAA
ncbi:MAG: rplJ [Rhodospirillales bacterium]|nr:rplJ [Rhodospirillales bacterium]